MPRRTNGPRVDDDGNALMAFQDSYRDLGISHNHAYVLLKNGRYPIPVIKIGERYRVRRADHAALVNGTGS